MTPRPPLVDMNLRYPLVRWFLCQLRSGYPCPGFGRDHLEVDSADSYIRNRIRRYLVLRNFPEPSRASRSLAARSRVGTTYVRRTPVRAPVSLDKYSTRQYIRRTYPFGRVIHRPIEARPVQWPCRGSAYITVI